MTELDLHGIRHEEAKRLLTKTINGMWGSCEDLRIITGHSPKMKEIVIDILDIYRLEYTIGDYSGQNMGYISTYLD